MNEHLTARQLLTGFTLDMIAQQPAERALLLYRAFAATTTSKRLRQRVTKIADQIEHLQRAQLQLRLDAVNDEKPTSGHPGNGGAAS